MFAVKLFEARVEGPLEAKMHLGCNDADELDCFKAHPTAHSKVFKPGNIQMAFLQLVYSRLVLKRYERK